MQLSVFAFDCIIRKVFVKMKEYRKSSYFIIQICHSTGYIFGATFSYTAGVTVRKRDYCHLKRNSKSSMFEGSKMNVLTFTEWGKRSNSSKMGNSSFKVPLAKPEINTELLRLH